MRGTWRERAFAAVYDSLNARMEAGFLGRRRAALLADVPGRVLEIGAGTGANLPHYRAAAGVVATEPSAPMRRRLAVHEAIAKVPVEVVDAPAEALPFEDASFDAAVATLVLCSVRDVDAALGELRRVLRPGAPILFLEHGGGATGRRGRWQHRLDRAWGVVSCGCHLTRDARANVERAGFSLARVDEFDPRGTPAVLRPFVEGVAIR